VPPLPRLRTSVLADLARELRFAPPAAARRHLERVEQLASDLEPGMAYPADWVVFRVTGLRSETAPRDMLAGADLAGELAALAEHLCVAARLEPAEHPGAPAGPWLTAAQLGARWSVSRKTLERYRRLGLMARRVGGTAPGAGLVFSRAAVERFERAHAERLRAAAAFSRLGGPAERRLLRHARRYREGCGLTLNQAALRLARRHGRSHEAVRQLLRRHAAEAGAEKRAGPLRARDRRLAFRARRLGVPVGAVCARLGCTPRALAAALRHERARLLRSLILPEAPGAARHAAVPDAPEVRTGLGAPGPVTLAALLQIAQRAGPVPAGWERTVGLGYWALLGRARAGISRLPRHGASAGALDRVETDLLWAARLKAELVRSQLPLLVRTIDSRLPRGLEHLQTAEAQAVVSVALDALAAAVDRYDPTRGGRLAAPCGLALTKAVSAWVRSEAPPVVLTPGRAAPRLDPARAVLPDFARRLGPWQAWLEPVAAVRPAAESLPPDGRALLESRFGWTGEPPATLAELAARAGTPVSRLSRQLQATLDAARAAARAAAGSSQSAR